MPGGGWRAASAQGRIGGARSPSAGAAPYRGEPKKRPKRSRFDPEGWSGTGKSKRAEKLKGTKSEYRAPDPMTSYKDSSGREYRNIDQSSDPWLRQIYNDRIKEQERAERDARFAMPEGWKPGDPIDYSGYSYDEMDERFTQGGSPGNRWGYRDPRATFNDISGYRLDNGEWTDQMKYEGALFDQFMRDRYGKMGFSGGANNRGLSGYRMDDEGNYTYYNPVRDASVPGRLPGQPTPVDYTFPEPNNPGFGGGGGWGGGRSSSVSGGSTGPVKRRGGGGGNFGGWNNPYSPGSFGAGYGTGPTDGMYGGGPRNVPMGGYGWDQSPWGGR